MPKLTAMIETDIYVDYEHPECCDERECQFYRWPTCQIKDVEVLEYKDYGHDAKPLRSDFCVDKFGVPNENQK